MNFALTLSLAVILDEIFGDPHSFPHPVRLIGNVITFWQKIFFRQNSFIHGLAVAIMTLMTAGLFVCVILYVTGGNIILQVYLLYSAIARRDLKDETLPVFLSLMNRNLDEARKFLSFVVGRDTENLDEAEITRAVIETVAENSADGVMSVIFFAALGHAVNNCYGMCLAVWLFKSASTLDSMLGYESFGRFGTPSARLDDILNFIPARIAGIIVIMAGALTGCDIRKAFRVFMSDRLKHKSPNSAHCESAFAGVLGVRLGGGAFYGGEFEPGEYLNEGGNVPCVCDIVRAWRVLDVSCWISVMLAIIVS